MRPVAQLLLLIVALLGACSTASAHPHIFVTATARIAFDDSGNLSAIDNIWVFDEAYSAWATEGLDANGDGRFDPLELAALSTTVMSGLTNMASTSSPAIASRRSS